ncbi:methyltransferase domain-containing protein [Lactobacillus sp. S2-2]|uniref:class I SAM-dependent DNA methyltransferase n=1 Tax=Lactobacillus sp. S2-2 TaxID=2692917 RepID=UPI001F29A0D8|nr:class I SAM-dependent methyltransferase [Lactobacillus sp. S2-2]MCF6515140.1 methyltransferase domain-containing protein [Lactobacillus sp. S2-2]
MIFNEFATFYDELFDPQMYQKWAYFVKNNYNKGQKILDLACGTGKLISILKKEGYRVEGSDLSDEMLAIADFNLKEAGFNVPLYNANMLDMSDLDIYDGITCFDDSLCYLSNYDDLKLAFKQIYQHLNNSSLFSFDVITPYQVNEVYPGYMYNYRDETRAFMWTSYLTDELNVIEHDLSFFLFNKNNQAYDEYNELHVEKTYTIDDYKNALIQAGFNNIKVTSEFGEAKIKDDSTRWFFTCSKG